MLETLDTASLPGDHDLQAVAWDANVAARRPAIDRPAEGRTLPLGVSGLGFAIDGRTIVDDLDLVVSGSGVTVVMGPNGAGKSVLLRLVHGLLTPTSGTITWGGRPLDTEIRKRQAMVFQKPVLLRRSVAANLDFVLGLRGRRAGADARDRLLELAGLSDRAGQAARALSGGEQQRLALVRALALEPEVLFLDEPTANLDPASVLRIETIIREAHGAGTKVILVTHDMGQARRLGDEIVFVHRGRIAEQRPAADFFTSPRSDAARGYLEGRIVL